jgi:hypothetical protein
MKGLGFLGEFPGLGCFRDRNSWNIVGEFEEKPKASAKLLRVIDLAELLPESLRRKLDPPPRQAILYRVR